MARVTPDADGWIVYAPPVEDQQTDWLAGALEAAVHDCRLFGRLAREAQLEGLPQKLKLSWDAFCEQRLHQPPEVVQAILAGLEMIGDAVPVPQEVAERVGRVVLAKHGGDRKSAEARNQHSPRSLKYGETTAYLLARLDRDYPTLAADVRTGKLKAKTAARQVGLIKIKTPLDQLRHWWAKADTVAQQTFLEEITELRSSHGAIKVVAPAEGPGL